MFQVTLNCARHAKKDPLSLTRCSTQIQLLKGYEFRFIFGSVNETGVTNLPGTVAVKVQPVNTSRLDIALRHEMLNQKFRPEFRAKLMQQFNVSHNKQGQHTRLTQQCVTQNLPSEILAQLSQDFEVRAFQLFRIDESEPDQTLQLQD